MKLSCVRYMLLLVPRSVMCPLCEGLCSFLQWQRLAVYSMGFGVPVQSVRVPLQLFLLWLFPVWCLSIVIDRCASSHQSPGSMLVWVYCVLCFRFCLGLFHGVSSCEFITLWACMVHNVCVMLWSSLVFLALCYMMMGGKMFIIFVLSQHMALSLLGYMQPHIQVHLGLLHTTPQTRTGSPRVPSSWGIAEHKWYRECDWPWMREGARLGQGAHARCKRYWKGAWALVKQFEGE